MERRFPKKGKPGPGALRDPRPPCCGGAAPGPYQGTAGEGRPFRDGTTARRGGKTVPGIVPPSGGRKQRGEGERDGPHHSERGTRPSAVTPRAF